MEDYKWHILERRVEQRPNGVLRRLHCLGGAEKRWYDERYFVWGLLVIDGKVRLVELYACCPE